MNNPLQNQWQQIMGRGVEAFGRNNPGEAATHFREATRLLPNAAASWVNLCTACIALEQHQEAIEAAQKAISLEPRMAPAHMMLGDAMRESGRQQEAAKAYQQAVDIQENPLALNKLGCALREERQLENAEKLFLRALELDPRYPSAKVNLVTNAVIQQQMSLARERLEKYKGQAFPPAEQKAFNEAELLLTEHDRLAPALQKLATEGDRQTLQRQLAETPETLLTLDQLVYDPIARFAESARLLSDTSPTPAYYLPDPWLEIEGLFMIPLVDSSESFRAFKDRKGEDVKASELTESHNMVASIERARQDRHQLSDPIQAEVAIRHWQALATHNLEGFMPGHFKYANNVLQSDRLMPRAEATATAQTFRQFIAECYCNLPPGLPRAALVLFAIIEIHPFVDGNGRTALTWMNRELEWAGLMPAVFTRPMGLRGELGKARRYVRRNPGDITPLLDAIRAGQALTGSIAEDLEITPAIPADQKDA